MSWRKQARRQRQKTSEVTRENWGGWKGGLEEEREKVVVDIISGLQAVSLHLMGQTSLLSHSPSLCLSLSLALTPSLSSHTRSAKISSSKQDLIMPIDKMSKYSFSPLEKNTLSTSWPDSTHTHTHTYKYTDSQSSYTMCLKNVKTRKALIV